MTNLQIRESAKSLFDGGWRSPEYPQMHHEYNLTPEEVFRIADALDDLEAESEHTYEIYEDNAGGLYLVVLTAGIPTYIFENWEFQPHGDLCKAIHELAADKLAYRGWNGDCVERINEDRLSDLVTAESLYDEGLGTLIAKITENGGTYYPDRMGTAARLALGIPQEV